MIVETIIATSGGLIALEAGVYGIMKAVRHRNKKAELPANFNFKHSKNFYAKMYEFNNKRYVYDDFYYTQKKNSELNRTFNFVKSNVTRIDQIFEYLERDNNIEGFKKADNFYCETLGALNNYFEKGYYYNMIVYPEGWENVEESKAEVETYMKKLNKRIEQQLQTLLKQQLNTFESIDEDVDEQKDYEDENNNLREYDPIEMSETKETVSS